MIKGINIVGIGVGIYPFGIKNLFPNVIYSKNPYKLIQGIASCFSGEISGKIKRIKSEYSFKFTNQDIKDAQENPKNQELKNLLSSIIIDLSGFNFVMDEIPEDAKPTEIINDGKYSIHNYGMYKKNYFQEQKLLIVMFYNYGMIDNEKEELSDKYIKESKYKKNECIQSSIDYTGIKCEVVTNYKDAINELTKSYKKDYNEYYACITMSGRPYDELPNLDDDPYLLGQFIKVVKMEVNIGQKK